MNAIVLIVSRRFTLICCWRYIFDGSLDPCPIISTVTEVPDLRHSLFLFPGSLYPGTTLGACTGLLVTPTVEYCSVPG